ncbi:FAM203 family protein [Auxenochlorella protothecoides]|uniref:FAM203 family protein n=2 Tax=Auxenochlorella protothecoides TaxID=3075 RepID=A0A087SG50_AUXPR|nr:FAM203 family protein [Auxenochlorella protothecoides]KFM24704.1 FAM203 family protein [Auxenochlorella protothecoides]RMZ53144.1 hypothetical protein APUTEX25_005133 [Auxenochlorella protothecoides]|eukprot:RMZ53144.1 hypothetical protein APUTEX25_005133 [Auxenochlorella protothecoides]
MVQAGQHADELQELIEFLSDKRAPVRTHAAELVEGLTGSPEGMSTLSNRADTLLPPLLRLIADTTEASRPALTALVNLAQEPGVQSALLALHAPARAMDYLRENACAHPGLLISLLANLTASEDGSEALLQLGQSSVEGLHTATLLKLFLQPVVGSEDTYEHVATILPNVTRLAAGRQLLLQPGRGLLTALSSQLRSKSELRRRGSARAIKNCFFAAEEDGTLEDILAEEAALTTMLDVISGGEAEGEADGEAREALSEALLCLVRVPTARKVLWRLDAPKLIGKGYELEEHRGVCAAMEAIAEFFLEDGFGEEGGKEGPVEDGPAGFVMPEPGFLPPGVAQGLSPSARRHSSGETSLPSNPHRLAHIEEIE